MSEPAIASPLRGISGAVSPLPHFGRAVLRGRPAQIGHLSRSLGVTLPQVACRSVQAGGLSALWLGPDEWLLLQSDPGESWASGRQAKIGETLCSLVDVSHRQIGIGVSGPLAQDLLATGCALDLSLAAFPVGMCTRTLFAKAEIVLWRTGDDTFHLEVWRSFARYLEGLLREAEYEA